MNDAWFVFGVGLSVLVHLVLVRGAGGTSRVEARTVDTLEWIALPPTPDHEPAAEEVETEIPVEPEQRQPVARPARIVQVDTRPAPADMRPHEVSSPIDLTGITLTTGSGGWAPSGNGEPGGPIRSPTTARNVTPASLSGSMGPSLVPVANLSRPPAPPNLDARLLERYPEIARRQGTPGSALVRARVLPSGRVDRIGVVDATSPRFARACQEVLRGSRWSAPLDRLGNPVATEIRYRCQFRVR